jgi:hypothetical protein
MNFEDRRLLMNDILENLGYDPGRPPVFLNETEAANVLGQKKGTLASWRYSGRHGLVSTKIGRAVFYRLHSIIDYIENMTKGQSNI